MREIKFRTWDGEKMLTQIPVEAVKVGKFIEFYGTTLKIMQFTGLKDCKGKEIYENDIVRYHFAYQSPRKVGEVKFDLGMFAILEMNEFEKERNEGGHYIKLSACNRVEVIGNIYENPKLLKIHGNI